MLSRTSGYRQQAFFVRQISNRFQIRLMFPKFASGTGRTGVVLPGCLRGLGSLGRPSLASPRQGLQAIRLDFGACRPAWSRGLRSRPRAPSATGCGSRRAPSTSSTSSAGRECSLDPPGNGGHTSTYRRGGPTDCIGFELGDLPFQRRILFDQRIDQSLQLHDLG